MSFLKSIGYGLFTVFVARVGELLREMITIMLWLEKEINTMSDALGAVENIESANVPIYP